MSTFSQIIDELVVEHLRPDLRVTITEYLNQTIREVHNKPVSSSQAPDPVLYESNRVEEIFTVPDTPPSWSIPDVTRFQRFETAWYTSQGVYSQKRHPSRAFQHGVNPCDPYWYRAGSYIVMNGAAQGEEVKLSYFQFPRRLTYYAVALRPATFDIETGTYTYLSAYD